MRCEITVRGPVVFADWRGFSLADLRAVIERIVGLRNALGTQVVYLSRIPSNARIFTKEENAALLEFLNTILPYCAAIHHVIEGDGFVKSARQAVVMNMAAATSRPRIFFTHPSLGAAAAIIKDTYKVDLGVDRPRERDEVPPSSSLEESAIRTRPQPEELRQASVAFRLAAHIAIDKRRPPRKA